MITAYQSALVMALLPCAALGESVGYRRVFTVGVALFVLASVLCALSPSLTWLVVARFVQYLPTCLAVIILRWRESEPSDGFRLPLGPVIPLLTLSLCTWLLLNTDPNRLLKGGIALLIGVPLYGLSRGLRHLQRQA